MSTPGSPPGPPQHITLMTGEACGSASMAAREGAVAATASAAAVGGGGTGVYAEGMEMRCFQVSYDVFPDQSQGVSRWSRYVSN